MRWGFSQCTLNYTFAHGAFCPLAAIMEEVLGKIAQFPPYTRGKRVACDLSSSILSLFSIRFRGGGNEDGPNGGVDLVSR